MVPDSKPDSRMGNRSASAPPRQAALLINLGTPDSTNIPDVRRYLAEFLSDPDVIQLPTGTGLLNPIIGHLIARFRAPASAHMYRQIWTDKGSPLRVITEAQTRALQAELGDDWSVFLAMRYGTPSIGDVLKDIEAAGIDELVVVPLYPQFTAPTGGTALRVLFKHLQHHDPRIQVTTRPDWHNDAGYIHAQAARLHEVIEAEHLSPQNTHLLFSAHSLPMSYIRRGDQYPSLVRQSVDLVTQRLGWPTDRTTLAYQSRVGPVEWLGPYTDEVLNQLRDDGEKSVLVCPITFTTDCLETLEEIGVRYRSEFEKDGARLHLCPALNTSALFISALRDLVERGSRPVSTWRNMRPLMERETPRAATDSHVDRMVMVGVSTDSRLGSGLGPRILSSCPESLRQVKRSQCDVPDFIKSVQKEVAVKESWLFNTCQRYEFHGWLPDLLTDKTRDDTIQAIRRRLFGKHEPKGLRVNVLFGVDVLHHLLRTAVGMNSGLPGERDILGQLQAAHRLAQCAGTAGPLSAKLLDDVIAFERAVSEDTAWGQFQPNYCQTAIETTLGEDASALADARIVVIGGSTTSASVLRVLTDRFEVPQKQLTLIYRGHKGGGQMKLLRKAIGNGRRIRVQAYTERAVSNAIADADVVFFGLDTETPVLTADQLRQCRAFTHRPLTVIDFNVFGSTSKLETIEGVTLHDASTLATGVAEFAHQMCASAEFRAAVEEAETRIRNTVAPVEPDRATSATNTAPAPGRARATSVDVSAREVAA